MDASGVPSSCDTEPIIAARNVSASERSSGFADGVRDVDPLQRGCGLRKRGIDALADRFDAMPRDVAELDRENADHGRCAATGCG